jgi:thiol-disulfide isomerase/thioredoxin
MNRDAIVRPSASRLAGAALIAALALSVLAGTQSPRAARAGEAVRDTAAYAAPDWTLRTADGGEASLHAALARGPVLVSFWALWCVPCLRELPHLDELARETAGRLTVLAVNQDGPRSVARVRPYLHSRRLRLIVPLDTSAEVAQEMQIGDALPFLVLYDAHGREAYRRIGYHDGDEVALRARVMELLGAVSPDTSSAR